MNEKWSFNSTDDDLWTQQGYNTKEEAIAEGKKYYDNGEETFFVGRYTQQGLSLNCDVDSILEKLGDKMYDEVGEAADGYLEDVKPEHERILEERLNIVIQTWASEFKYNPSFYKVVDVEKIDNR